MIIVAVCRMMVPMVTGSHPVVFLSELLGLLLIGLLLRLGQLAPHLAQFLGTVSYGQTRVLLLHTGAVLTAEHEERRPAHRRVPVRPATKAQSAPPVCVRAEPFKIKPDNYGWMELVETYCPLGAKVRGSS